MNGGGILEKLDRFSSNKSGISLMNRILSLRTVNVLQKVLLFPRTKVNDSEPSGCDEELAFLVDSSKL